MRKVFIVGLVLLMVLVGMSAAAETTTTTALTTGNRAVMFNNGYTGFCIDRLLDGATTKQVEGGVEEIRFAVQSGSTAMSNKYNTSIEQYLKAAIVEYHDTYFPRTDNVGGYYDAYQNGSDMNFAHLAWVFSDFEYKKITPTMDKTAFEAVVTQPITFNTTLRNIVVDVRDRVDDENWVDIPDHGYRKQIDADTYAVFDFAVMNPGEAYNTVQHFFSFKITYYREVEVDLSQTNTLTLDASIPSGKMFSYAWEEVGADDPVNCTDGKYIINPVSDVHHQKTYRCTVKDIHYGYTHYAADYYFEIRVKGAADKNNPPEITAPASDQSVIFTAEDEKIELVATATDADGDVLTFTWYEYVENSSPVEVSGAVTNGNTSTLTLDPSEGDYDGKVYYCKVDDKKDGTTPDQSAKFTLKELTVQWANGTSVTVNEGDDVPLEVTAKNATKYEWYKVTSENTRTLLGETTTPTYTLNDVTAGDNGSKYVCAAVNQPNGGTPKTAETTEFTLNVTTVELNPPEFVQPDTNTQEEIFKVGGEVTLFAALKEENADSFEWYVKRGDGEPELIEGENGKMLVLKDRKAEDNATVYFCVARNDDGMDTSLSFKLVLVGDKPVFTSPADNTPLEFVPGDSLILTAIAENADSYQWYVDQGNGELVPVEGADQSSYTTGKLGEQQEGWAYLCVAENAFGNATSKAYVLCLTELPQMPKTGDSSDMRLWMSLMVGAMSMLALIVVRKRSMSR